MSTKTSRNFLMNNLMTHNYKQKLIKEIAESHQGRGKMEQKIAYLEKKLAAIAINISKDDEEPGSHSGTSQLDTGLLAQSTQQIAEIKQGMENIAQELTAKTSNLVTNERVAKLETEINDDLVKKIAKLEMNAPNQTATGHDKKKKKKGKQTKAATRIKNHTTEGKPSSTSCTNCKSNPCLKGKQITFENFAAGAMFQATLSRNKNTAFGFTQIAPEMYEGWEFKGSREKQPDEKWFIYENKGKTIHETFNEKHKSLVYNCCDTRIHNKHPGYWEKARKIYDPPQKIELVIQ